jgi:phage gp36-like protein
MYITVEELTDGIHAESLTAITRGDNSKATQAIEDAMAMVRSYICVRYDIEAEYAKTGAARDGMTVKLVRDIAIYYCYEGSSPVNMPETREKAYDDAIAFLKSVQAEKAALPGLARLDGSEGSNYVKFGGNRKMRNKWL